MLAHPQLGRGVPLLLLANKHDLPTALAPVEIAQARTRGGRGPALRAARPAGQVPRRARSPRRYFLAPLVEPAAFPRVPLANFGHPTLCPSSHAPHQALRLEDIRQRPWQIVPSNALTGEGLDRGVDWLAGKLLSR